MAQDIAVRVRRIRQRLGLTQEGLAEQLGVSFVTVNRWEAGKSKPRSRYMSLLEQLGQADEAVTAPARQPFRPIQYLGSKLRLVEHIEAAIGECSAGQHVVDLFTGSGVVASRLAERFCVTATDIQQYSCDLARALLLPRSQVPAGIDKRVLDLRGSAALQRHEELFGPLIEQEDLALAEAAAGNASALLEFTEGGSLTRFNDGTTPPTTNQDLRRALSRTNDYVQEASRSGSLIGHIALLYGGTYFSYRQAVAIDTANHLRQQLDSDKPEHAILLGSLLSAASHVCNTVGKQFAQPMRLRKRDGSTKGLLVQRTLRDRSLDLFDAMQSAIVQFRRALPHSDWLQHQVIRADYRDFLREADSAPSCFYADPPYTIDHYSRFYHVLETIARSDLPKMDVVNRNGRLQLSNGLYRSDRHQSPFCIPSQVRDAFRSLFEGVRRLDAPIVLSYSPFAQEAGRSRLLTLDQLQELAGHFFADVSMRYIGEHRHRKLHWNTAPNGTNPSAEALIICQGPRPRSQMEMASG